MEANPISGRDVESWECRRGLRLQLWEERVIYELDRLYREAK